MADSTEGAVPGGTQKRKRSVFASDEERKNAHKERKREFDQTRIRIGDASKEWERQRNEKGMTNSDFAAHLLRVHATHCGDCQHTDQVHGHVEEGTAVMFDPSSVITKLDGQEMSRMSDNHSKAKLNVTMTNEEAIKTKKVIAYTECLDRLVKVAVGQSCPQCKGAMTFRHVYRGTCLLILWECGQTPNHYSGTWASQPRQGGMYSGNLLLPTALLLSGNNYAKVAKMAQFLNLAFVGESNVYRIQDKYVIPAVDEYWISMQSDLLTAVTDALVLAADGRNDTPGHSAEYCTVSCMDVLTKKILALACIDVREAALKSVNMEKKGFERTLGEILQKAPVAEVVTDGHPQIKAYMKHSEVGKTIIHQMDVWHFVKNFVKKLTEVAKQPGCRDLIPWINDIKKHLWHCSSTCDGDAVKLKEDWTKVVNHVCNRHTWATGSCSHPPMTDPPPEHSWIKPASPAHKALLRLVWDKTLMANLTYIRNYRHTGALEVFNSNILMYCSKRQSYTFPAYQMRNELAAIDHNEHQDRAVQKNANGEVRHTTHFSKATKKWSASPLKEQKKYAYIPTLMLNVTQKREAAEQRMDARVVRRDADPRNIRPTIAAVLKPDKKELIKLHETRFGIQT